MPSGRILRFLASLSIGTLAFGLSTSRADEHPAPKVVTDETMEAGVRMLAMRDQHAELGFVGGFIGLRASRNLSLGLYGDVSTLARTFDACRENDSCPTQYGRFGIFARVHLAPAAFVDPWLSIAGGGTTRGKLGADMELTLGADLRVHALLAFGPMGLAIVPLSGGAPIRFGGGLRATIAF